MTVPAGQPKNFRVVLHWANFPTCPISVRTRLVAGAGGPRIERYPAIGPCTDPARPMDFGLRVWRDGQLAAFADAKDGTWEVVDIEAKQGGAFEIEVVGWEPPIDQANYLGLAWSVVPK